MNTINKFCVPLTGLLRQVLPDVRHRDARDPRDLDWRGRLKLVDCSAPDFDDGAAAAGGRHARRR